MVLGTRTPTLHQRCSSRIPISSLPRRAGVDTAVGSCGSATRALASWRCLILTPIAHRQPRARRLPHLGKHNPTGKLSFGKSLKAHVPQRASSPSAVTRGIWYSEFWSIWRWMWCDLQQGNRDRLTGKESKFFPYFCHQPPCYSLNQYFGSALKRSNTVT